MSEDEAGPQSKLERRIERRLAESDEFREGYERASLELELEEELRELIDLGHRAIDALVSTTVPPRDLPDWLWDVARELHRVGGHGEPPAHETTQRLHEQVERAYDQQSTDPSWWAGRE